MQFGICGIWNACNFERLQFGMRSISRRVTRNACNFERLQFGMRAISKHATRSACSFEGLQFGMRAILRNCTLERMQLLKRVIWNT